jgi:hypothetical protein
VCKACLRRREPALPKKQALELFPFESRALLSLCALAHNFVHKKCAEASWTVQTPRLLHAANFFIAGISLIRINNLPSGKAISHKFIHRNCGQVRISFKHVYCGMETAFRACQVFTHGKISFTNQGSFLS